MDRAFSFVRIRYLYLVALWLVLNLCTNDANQLYLHAHLNADNERMSMLFVFADNVTGADILVAVTRGFGRVVSLAYTCSHSPGHQLAIRNENDAEDFLDSTGLFSSQKLIVHADVHIYLTGVGASRLAASNLGPWNISQMESDDKADQHLLGQIDLQVDQILTELVQADVGIEFPRSTQHFDTESVGDHPRIKMSEDISNNLPMSTAEVTLPSLTEALLNRRKGLIIRPPLSAGHRQVFCDSPNAFAPPPRIFTYKSLYFFQGNGMYFLSAITGQLHVYSLGHLQRMYGLALASLDVKGKTVLDVGSGLGFVSFYALIEGQAKHAIAMDIDYNYLGIIKSVLKRPDLKFLSKKLSTTEARFATEEGDEVLKKRKFSADVVVATNIIHSILLCQGAGNIGAKMTRKKNGLLLSMEKIIREFSLRTKETLIIEFIEHDDPTVVWAGGYNRAQDSLILPTRSTFVSLLSAYFHNIDILGHPSPTRTLYMGTKHFQQGQEGNNLRGKNIVYGGPPLASGTGRWFSVIPKRRPPPPLLPLFKHTLIGIVVEGKVETKYMRQALSLIQSFRWHGGELNALATVLVCVLPGVPTEFREKIKELGGIVRPIKPMSASLPNITPHSNKLRFFEQPEALDGFFQTVVYLDCDILIMESFHEMLAFNWPSLDIGGKITRGIVKFRAGRTMWGQFVFADPVWQRTFELGGVIRRGQTVNYMSNIWPNTGVIVFAGLSSYERQTFVDSWIGFTDKVLHWLSHMTEDAYFTETLSFVLAMLETRLPFELLPVQMNLQLNFPKLDMVRNGYMQSLLAVRPSVIHYPMGTLQWHPYGYIVGFSRNVEANFPFVKEHLPIGHINQFYDQSGEGPPWFHGHIRKDLQTPVYIQLEHGKFCSPFAQSYSSFIVIENGGGGKYVTERSFQTLRHDIAAYCQHAMDQLHIDWYDGEGDRLELRELVDLQEALMWMANDQKEKFERVGNATVSTESGGRDDGDVEFLVLKLWVQ